MPAEVRHQVFVSSTFDDLQEERREVIDGLLDLDCIPCGMEYFPADNEEVWNGIKRLIDGCDYYVVIVAGRYGSMSSDGKSFTQKEYEYAASKGIPVFAFLHENPESIIAGKTEKDAEPRRKLEDFRVLCRERRCRSWDSPGDLRAKVVSTIATAKKLYPKPGWVRADYLPDESAAQMMNRLRDDMERLRGENEGLRAQLKAVASPAEPDVKLESLASENIQIKYTFQMTQADQYGTLGDPIANTWPTNARVVFGAVARSLATVGAESGLATALATAIEQENYGSTATVQVPVTAVQDVMLRLRRLALVEKASNGLPGQWTLTGLGEKLAIELITRR